MNIPIKTLRLSGGGGITVVCKFKNCVAFIVGVPENIIRCAFGEGDMEYLLTSRNDESQCFSICMAEYNDFVKHSFEVRKVH